LFRDVGILFFNIKKVPRETDIILPVAALPFLYVNLLCNFPVYSSILFYRGISVINSPSLCWWNNFFCAFFPQPFRQAALTSRMLSHLSIPGWLL